MINRNMPRLKWEIIARTGAGIMTRKLKGKKRKKSLTRRI
jgi:hypothetical protein